MTPTGPTPDPILRTRRQWLQQCLDVLLPLLLTLAILAGYTSPGAPDSSGRDLVNREDRWRFEAMPASEDGLLAWSRSQPDLRNFRVQRVQAGHQLVLRYELTRAEGPAHPDWELLGYRMSYLMSAPSLQTTRNAGSFWISLTQLLLTVGLMLRGIQTAKRRELGTLL